MASNSAEKIIKEAAKETAKEIEKRVGILMEGLQSDVQHIAEAVDIHTQQLGRFEGVPDTLDRVENQLVAIEAAFESVNLPILKQKVTSLEKRVAMLEAKRS